MVFYTPDTSIAPFKWKRIPAKCRDSFGLLIGDLPSDSTYKVCVVTAKSAKNASLTFHDENCDSVALDKGIEGLKIGSLTNFGLKNHPCSSVGCLRRGDQIGSDR